MGDSMVQLSLRNITKSYGHSTILKDISLEVKAGDFICIFGKSGSGKSTLLNILGTLESYDKGEVICFSKKNPIRSEKEAEQLRRLHIAYLFQNFALVEKMTVKENLVMAMTYSKQREKGRVIQEVLSKMKLADKLKSKVYELSGGEQQRIALARNMLKPFDIMLADEPTGSLDKENKQIVMDILLDLNRQGKTIIVVTHDSDFMALATKCYQLDSGQLQLLDTKKRSQNHKQANFS